MNNNIQCVAISVFLFLQSTLCFADISSDLTQFFNQMGPVPGVNQGNAYQGQQAGYYTTGNLFSRGRIRAANVIKTSLPSYRAGCGGIDFFNGGFSFINAPELVDSMKNIINNAETFAFELALESISPMISAQMKHLQQLANDVNQNTLNACETTTALVGSSWSKTELAQKKVCESLTVGQGWLTDAAKARWACGSGGQRSALLKRLNQQSQTKDFISINKNIVWDALKKYVLTRSDKQLAEFFMTLSGSVIYKQGNQDDEAIQKIMLVPRGNEANIIRVLLYGGAVTLYHCQEAQACLNPVEKQLVIPRNVSFVAQIQNILQSITSKIRTDTALSELEKGFLNATVIPVYKILNVRLAYTRGASLLNLEEYAQIIALDIITQYLTQALRDVNTVLQQNQFDDVIFERFQTRLTAVMKQIYQEQQRNMMKINHALKLVQQSRLLEKQLEGRLTNMMRGL